MIPVDQYNAQKIQPVPDVDPVRIGVNCPKDEKKLLRKLTEKPNGEWELSVKSATDKISVCHYVEVREAGITPTDRLLDFPNNIPLALTVHNDLETLVQKGGAAGSSQLVNMASITRHLRITPEKIKELNAAGNLYDALCTKAKELNSQALKDLEIADIKENPIQNAEELGKIKDFIEPKDNEFTKFIVWFDQDAKKLEVAKSTRRKEHFRHGSLRGDVVKIINSYTMNVTIYSDNSGSYLRIDQVRGLWKDIRDISVLFSEAFVTPDSYEADRLRQEVLEIYQTP